MQHFLFVWLQNPKQQTFTGRGIFYFLLLAFTCEVKTLLLAFTCEVKTLLTTFTCEVKTQL